MRRAVLVSCACALALAGCAGMQLGEGWVVADVTVEPEVGPVVAPPAPRIMYWRTCGAEGLVIR